MVGDAQESGDVSHGVRLFGRLALSNSPEVTGYPARIGAACGATAMTQYLHFLGNSMVVKVVSR
jgi:hypothetical protein